MYWILDLVFAVFLLLIVVFAAKRGFVRSVYRFAALAAAIFIAITFSVPAASFLEKKFLRRTVYDAVDGVVAPVAKKLESFSPQALAADLPDGFCAAAKMLGADIDAAAAAVSLTDEQTPVSAQITDGIAAPITHTLSRLLGFAAVFLIAYILLRLLGLLLSGLTKLPVLRGIDRFLGFLFGLCEASVLGVLLSGLLISVCGAYALSHPEFPFADLEENTRIIAFFAGLFS